MPRSHNRHSDFDVITGPPAPSRPIPASLSAPQLSHAAGPKPGTPREGTTAEQRSVGNGGAVAAGEEG
jgi:hypothetical protein